MIFRTLMMTTGAEGFRMVTRNNKPSIYVVDDDDAVRDSLDLYFTFKGMQVTAFGSAQALLDHKLIIPSLLIIDVNMPDMDGLELVELLQGRGHRVPVIMVTGLENADIRARSARFGVAALLTKPIDTPLLYATVTRLLALPHPAIIQAAPSRG